MDLIHILLNYKILKTKLYGLPASNNVTNTETPANTTDAIIYRVRLFLSPSSNGKMLVIIVSFNMHQ